MLPREEESRLSNSLFGIILIILLALESELIDMYPNIARLSFTNQASYYIAINIKKACLQV